jgi:hypothetical protein
VHAAGLHNRPTLQQLHLLGKPDNLFSKRLNAFTLLTVGIITSQRYHNRSRLLRRFGANPTNETIKVVPRKHNRVVIRFLSPAPFFLPITFLPATGELRVQAGDNLGGNLRSHGESKGARIGDQSTSVRTNTLAIFSNINSEFNLLNANRRWFCATLDNNQKTDKRQRCVNL